METMFINKENSKAYETYKFAIKLSKRLDSKSSNKHAALEKRSKINKQV